jgi:dihydroxyacetone kinase phosphotransfer subunit
MVSLIIVSHSHQLAEGVKEMAEQMAGAGVQVAAVGGLIGDSGEWLLGTDAMRIAAAIQAHWSEDGALLLIDMGSALFSAEQAIEFLPIDLSTRCTISNAPLVEGAIVAALEASMGRTLAAVNTAAEAAAQMHKL